jgi:hypothetical protein
VSFQGERLGATGFFPKLICLYGFEICPNRPVKNDDKKIKIGAKAMTDECTDQLSKIIMFVCDNFDELGILTSLIKIALNKQLGLNTNDLLVLEAFRRFKPDLADANISQIGSYLKSLDLEQMEALAEYVKGITHELIYEEMRIVA